MGNYKFKLSDLIPNSLFYKLKHMNIGRRNQKKEPSSSTSPTQPHPILLQYSRRRKSHHFTRQLAAGNSDPAEPPRKSSKGKPSRPRTAARTTSPRLLVAASSSGCTCARVDQSVTAGPSPPALLTQYSFHAHEEDSNAIIFQKGHKITPKKMNGPDGESKSSMTQIDLPPIITTSSSSSSKPEETIAPDASTCPSLTIAKNNKSSAKEPSSSSSSPSRRFPVNSPRPSKVRIMNSSRPSVSSKRFAGHHSGRRKSGSPAAWKRISLTHSSLAIVKSTNDPQRDFRESMVEMIAENKISGSNELEDLLACYLSLNTHEYHDIIIKVFKQIWFDITDIIENAN